jgi:hypothetical protein
MNLEKFFIDLGLDNLVKESRGRSRGVNEMQVSEPYKPDLNDLYLLYMLVRKRKVCTILEFGVGWSTLVFAKALSKNQEECGRYVEKNLRRNNPFELHSVDNQKRFIDIAESRIPNELKSKVRFYCSDVKMTTWNGRIATEYEKLPLINPDFIYLDAPDQFEVKGEKYGIHTRHKDMMPMSCDILKIEHFLTPSTLIVIDGRAANARFLRCNLQRGWAYKYDRINDQHFFELKEESLGRYNEKQIKFCLGDAWKHRKRYLQNKR